MHLRIHSLTKTFFDGTARSLTCPTTEGEVTILPHHIPLITQLASGMMKIVTEKNEEIFVPVTSGFLEVKDNEVVVLID